MIYRFETPRRAADAYRESLFTGLGDDTFTAAMTTMMNMTPEDVRAASVRYFDRSRMHVSVVGDLSALREPLGKLGWGPVEVRDAEGNVVPPVAPRAAPMNAR